VISVSGAVLEYEDSRDFVGRYWAEKSSLLTLTVAPSVADKVSEDFSVGFGLAVTLGVLDMDVAIPAPAPDGVEGLAEISEGKDIGVAGGVAFLWDVTDRSRLGLAYLGETEFDFEGDLDLTLPGGGVDFSHVDVNVEIPLAQTVRLSGSLDVSDRITLLATLAWEDWSTLDALPISTNAGGGALKYDWEDTWRYAVGARIRGAGKWTWYTGAAFDTDPTSASKRTADLPVDQQIRLSAGARFDKSDRVTLGGAITIADLGDAEIDNGGVRPINGDPWAVEGDFDTNRAIFAAFNVNWK
jgi:long-chain fatty acid transport protein